MTTNYKNRVSLGRSLTLTPLLALIVLAFAATPALAEAEGPGWEVTAHTFPTYLQPGGKEGIAIRVINVGAANSNGTVTVTDTLPPGIKATGAGSYLSESEILENNYEYTPGHPKAWDCAGDGPGGGVDGASIVTCTNDETNLPFILGGGGNPTLGKLTEGSPEYLAAFGDGDPQLGISVEVPQGISEGTREGAEANHVTVAGGGALAAASTQTPVTVSSASSPFGFAGADAWFSNADGTLDMQAGSHPYEATFNFDLNNDAGAVPAGHEPRNLSFDLPPGLIGNPSVVPQCPLALFVTETHCPADTQAGVIAVVSNGGDILSGNGPRPVWNLVPAAGQPAEFGFVLDGNLTLIKTAVRSGSDYGITSVTDNITRTKVLSAVLTLWGEPSASSHAPWRCEGKPFSVNYNCDVSSTATYEPFLTLPTACGNAQEFALSVNSWEVPGEVARTSFLTHDANDQPVGFTGCEDLSFGPALETSPDTAAADTPAGLTVDVKPPLGGLETTEDLGTADIKETTVKLPAGMVINPGQAAGLQACGPGEDGLTPRQEEGLPEAPHNEEDNGPPSCPNTSKVGTVKARTPLLEGAAEKELEGDVYVLRSNPPHLKLLAAFSADGVNIKLVLATELCQNAGETIDGETCQAPGQLVTHVANIPETPVSDFKLSFSGGPQAALDTPTQCGTYTTTSGFASWSSPFISGVSPTAIFNIASGPGGSACPSNPLPFSPTLTAGSTTDQAGGFTNFSLLLQRGDGQQRISGLRFKAPAGLTGELANVPLCTNAQAETNTCPEASKIGHTVVESGPGPYPLVVPEPGQPPAPIYLTEAYGGAPFGLSIVVPLHVGPFELPTQRVRARIEINPVTTQLTITTNELPQIVAGVPTDLREVDAVIERPDFMVNPTNCSPQEFTGTATGTPAPGAGGPGATAPIGSHFGVGACQALKFEPKFSVSATGKNSKPLGAGLTAKVSYPNVPQGTDADISLVKVELPKQLPSQLKTLQKACTSAQFNENPANCPKDSKIGMAIVHTPLLPVPLVGPAIFVSHGGEAFPSLTLVLQGDGVTIDLVGTTFISRKSITSTTFKTVPDDPFSSFELTLPQGEYAALSTNLPEKDHDNLCGQKLVMPTEMIAQNGAVFKQSTKIAITGCAKVKALTRTQKLKAALKACHRDKNKAKRAKCEASAHKKYGTVKQKKGAKKK